MARNQGICMLGFGSPKSEKLQELIHIQTSLLQDVGKGGALDGAVGWNDELQGLFRRPLLEADVTASLADDNPAVTA